MKNGVDKNGFLQDATAFLDYTPQGKEAGMVEKAYRPDYRRVVVRTSDGEIIQGSINIASKERVSDIFTKQENPFVVMKDVYFRENRLETLIVNKTFIVWVEPLD